MRKLLSNEDWLAFFTGLAVLLAAWAGLYYPSVKLGWADSSSFAGLFTSTGNIKGLVRTGDGRPAWAFLLAQLFNIFITLIIAFLLFR